MKAIYYKEYKQSISIVVFTQLEKFIITVYYLLNYCTKTVNFKENKNEDNADHVMLCNKLPVKSPFYFQVSYLHTVPSIVNLLARHPAVQRFDLSSLRACLTGSAPVSDEMIEHAVQRIGVEDLLFRQGTY